MNIENLSLIIPAFGILALLFTWWKTKQINAQPEGTPKMAKIAASIQEGAMAFLKAEYKVLFVFVIAVAILLGGAGHKTQIAMFMLQFHLLWVHSARHSPDI